LRHATPARRIILLPATVNFYWDPQFPRVLSFGFWRCFAARCWPLCRVFGALPVSIAACSVGTSRCSASDSMSTEVSSLHSRRASEVYWQAIVSFRHAVRSELRPLR
jgi:hypothetical protein